MGQKKLFVKFAVDNCQLKFRSKLFKSKKIIFKSKINHLPWLNTYLKKNNQNWKVRIIKNAWR